MKSIEPGLTVKQNKRYVYDNHEADTSVSALYQCVQAECEVFA